MRFKFLYPCLTVSFIVSFVSFSYAQNQGILKGIVTDATNKELIVGANIYDLNDLSHGAVTDIDGKYQLRLNPGKRTIVCSFISMKPDTLIVMGDSLKTTEHNFNLKPVATQLETMVVVAGKYEQKLSEITVSMEVIKPSLIENKNSANIKGALEQAPGLNILDGEPQIRGGSGFNFGIGSRVAILIDGLPALAGDGGRPEWNFIPLENVEQIEIIKGASSVTYGSSALSGSINIRTAYPTDKPITKVSLSAGMYDAPSVKDAKWWNGMANFGNANFLHSEKIGQLDLVVGGMGIYDHGFIGPPSYHPGFGAFNDTTIRNNQVGEKTGRLNFNLRYRPKNITQLNYGINGNFMRSTNNLSLIWDNDTTGLYRAFPHTMTLQNQTIFYIDPFVNFYGKNGFKQSLRARYFYTENKFGQSGDGANTTTNNSNVIYCDYQLIKQLKNGLNITGGFVMNQTYAHSGTPYKGILPENHLQNFAYYAQLDRKFWKILNLSAGFRNETFIMNDEKPVSKSIFRSGLNLQITEATFLRASYGQGYRFPTITEKYMRSDIAGLSIYPNPILKAESSWNTEIGIKQAFKINNFIGALDVAVFWQEFTNTIEFTYGVWDRDKDQFGDDSLSAGFKYINTGATRVRGFEVSLPAEGKITKDLKIGILADYTYVLPQAINPNKVFITDSTYTEMTYVYSSTDSTNNVLKYRFQHIAKIDFQVTYKKFSIGGDFRYYSNVQNIDKIFYVFEPQMHSGIEKYRNTHNTGVRVIDARIGVDVTKNFKIAFIVNNALNLSYSLRPLKIESPRTFAVRLSCSF
ncbi:MAG: TonB-dependent receptor [Bacteroidia bacterium]|jgi:iron complex outermembrane receptor protein